MSSPIATRILPLLLMVVWPGSAFSGGQVLKEESVPSHFLQEARTIRVYLPASYQTNSSKRYPVLYLNDGQGMFTAAGPGNAEGWGNWALDRTVDELSASGKMQEIIMVAVNASRSRFVEYNGRKSIAGEMTSFENYASFLTEELKPRMDSTYRTQADGAHTGILGSALGGLCALSVAWQYPEVFGQAACLSGAFESDQTNFLKQTLGGYRGKPKLIRIYLDSGRRDYSGDDDYALTREAYGQLRRIGWNGRNLKRFTDESLVTMAEFAKSGVRHDKWVDSQASQHNELYWQMRAWRALVFIFPPGGK